MTQLSELRQGRPEAAAAIWNPRGKPAETAAPASGRVRLMGALRAALTAAVGALLFFFWSQTVAYVVFTIATIVLLAALISPHGLYAGIERLLEALGRVTGRALSWVSLSLIFYAIFLPFGALFRRGARDSLQRCYEADAESYWTPHGGTHSGSRQATRQF